MICPHCNRDGKALVFESRPHAGEVYRQRTCGHCGKAFVTQETAPLGLRMPRATSRAAREEQYLARRRPALTTLNWKPPK